MLTSDLHRHIWTQLQIRLVHTHTENKMWVGAAPGGVELILTVFVYTVCTSEIMYDEHDQNMNWSTELRFKND